MKYEIKEDDTHIKISIDEIDDQRRELLKAFQECQEGRCTCPTTEYEKLDKLEINESENGMTMNLKAKDGMKFDKSNLEKCLEYTKEQVLKGN